ncbi:MAG: tRNA (N(6)-L-threonylcarbamoyladenosine(37)-C(2))-methylthiotransferase [Candidatus Hodarchaeota archaeon]
MNSTDQRNKSIKILNYGCSANRAIAEGLIGILQRNGYPLAESIEETDVIIVNTCIVKQNTEHRMKSLLLSLPKNKNLIVTGCLPVVMRNWITEYLPHAKVLFPEAANQIIELLNEEPVLETKIVNPSVWSQLYTNRRRYFNPVITSVEISRGCLSNCAYCIVKNVKGKIRSRSQESILSEIRTVVSHGCKEIWLTSQDTGTFGWDLTPKQFIPSLLESIVQIKADFFVRLGMMTPNTLKNFKFDLITQMGNKKVFKFLHLPIQSGSDTILRAMRRKEDVNYYIELVDTLRQGVDALIIATDIIVGFPGEAQTDFNATKKLLQRVKPTIVNISKYTDRPGTLAAKMPDKIPTKTKSSRSKELSELTQKITSSNLKKWVGWKGIALIDEIGKKSNQYIGRTTSYIPTVIEDKTLSLGQILEVQISDSGPTYLFGEKYK